MKEEKSEIRAKFEGVKVDAFTKIFLKKKLKNNLLSFLLYGTMLLKIKKEGDGLKRKKGRRSFLKIFKKIKKVNL